MKIGNCSKEKCFKFCIFDMLKFCKPTNCKPFKRLCNTGQRQAGLGRAAFCRNLIFVPTYALFKLFWTAAASVSWIPGSNFGRAVWYLEAQLKFLFWPRGNLICKIYCLKWLFFSGWLHKMHYWMLTKSFHFNAAGEEKLYWLHRQE